TKNEIEWTGDQSFQHGDLQRIGQRDLARQIVVQSPRYAGTNDSEWANDVVKGRCTRPRQYGSSCYEAGHANRNTTVKVLVENEPTQLRPLGRPRGSGGGRQWLRWFVPAPA